MNSVEDAQLPPTPPPPVQSSHKMSEDGTPLLHHGTHSHDPLLEVDLEAGSKQRARAMAILAMVTVLVAGVVRKYPYVSGVVLVVILLVFFIYSFLLAFCLFIGALLSKLLPLFK